MSEPKWDFWIDRGGTFTDIVARTPDGDLVTHKLLSENPDRYADAALAGIRALLGLSLDAPLPHGQLGSVKMGTTVATNALLERKGEPLLFLTSQGFADALAIGTQNRPHLFRLAIEKPSMLYADAAEVPERISASGEIITPLDEAGTRKALEAAYASGLRAVAISFLHGYRYPMHEARAAEIAREIGFTQVTTGHGASPLMKFVPRSDTAVVDAYLTPILRRYVDRVAADLAGSEAAERLYFMQSSGGLTPSDLFQGKDAILSGPAGGVVGAVETARAAGFEHMIGFDMGGTSTDVCHFDGAFERTLDAQVAGVRVRAPMMAIHTVAAGGGSVISFDSGRLRVGPGSAGADPGPACYRRGGPLTVTDANLLLGRIQPALFPCVFGPNGDEPLDPSPVREGFEALAREIGRPAEEIAEGAIRIAVESMAQAIKKITVERGRAISGYLLNCFGGAAGQHAAQVADALGLDHILFHPFSGLLSAYGMGLADIRALRAEAVEAPLSDEALTTASNRAEALIAETCRELTTQGLRPDGLSSEIRLTLRYQGADKGLTVPLSSSIEARQAFEEMHRERFGFILEEKPILIESVTVETVGRDETVRDLSPALSDDKDDGPDTVSLYCDGAYVDARRIARNKLRPGIAVDGPALISEPHATIVVEPGWRAEMDKIGNVRLERYLPRAARQAIGTQVDPIMLEVFNNRFMSIAEQMGAVLELTAHSVNIKERLDFSCAVFDAEGGLVANAPHMPVHLGSMGASVARVIDANQQMHDGDVFVLNDPYRGGTHLPDVTVVAPVFLDSSPAPTFFVAARGHHADIGGIAPGSMPASSRTVAEEGVLIDNFKLVDRGRLREAEMRNLLASGPYPARNPDQNMADLAAQVAATRKGQAELRQLTDQFGLDVVTAYMGHVQDNAAACVEAVIEVVKDGRFELAMDDGSIIRVAITVDRERRRARIDFTGTSDAVDSNLNAPAPVAKAAVLYVFRCLVEDEIPLNEGCLRPLDIVLPEGSLLNPAPPAAVVGGNVETSQAVTDALFAALGACAAAQGTMNNFTFGNDEIQYYETICGGAGAGADFDGADAVQTHMTNSRLTDPEVLEWRFPVVLENFRIRRGSGGAGAHKGGDGVERCLRFTQPVAVSLLTTRRTTRPFGLLGGSDAASGENRLTRGNGREEELPGAAFAELDAGDRLTIRTPGGGGFGTASQR